MLKRAKIFWAPIHYTKLLFAAVILSLSLAARPVAAADQPHYTLIINQVRGSEAFDPGNIDYFKRQVDALREEKLVGVFAIRYDALNQTYGSLLKQASANGNEIAALLEITPGLAGDSKVSYHATAENQYLSAHAYLVGYTPDDRKKLIDTYMAKFKNFFGFSPRTTVSWMIDSYSLQYLRDRYSVSAHEITREQWDTDSSTLSGGPPHYPYYPSSNWALIPSIENSEAMPLIIRQTITDPVENYGDFTNSHTSQPNDYGQRNADFSYFTFLFRQAHNQPQSSYTFAVAGLENSMAENYQDEFIKQIKYISLWQKSDTNNKVVTVQDFISQNHNLDSYPQIYEGAMEASPASKAWWITTPSYRIRLRLDNGSLYISDVRIYDQNFVDPYFDVTATDAAYWVVPFLLDGSRFITGAKNYDFVLSPLPDSLTNKPTRIELANNIPASYDVSDSSLFLFSKDWFEIPDSAKFILDNPIAKFNKLEWTNFIGLSLEHRGSVLRATPWSNADQLQAERASQFPLLLPHLSVSGPDFNKSLLYVNNRYSVFGRNPIRFVFFPKDRNSYPATLGSQPAVSTNPPANKIIVGSQNWLNGAIYIDIFPGQPGEMKVNMQVNNTNLRQTAYSSPDCKSELGLCLLHPWYIWWYLHTLGR